MGVFVRNPYNYDMDMASEESGLDCSVEPSLAKQSFAEECDINTIVRRFGLTGELPKDFAERVPQYGDFSEVTDFKTALEAVMAAQDKFMEMPAALRARFNNDPQELLDFVSNEQNREEAVRLGLVPERKAEPPAPVPVAPAAPVPAST